MRIASSRVPSCRPDVELPLRAPRMEIVAPAGRRFLSRSEPKAPRESIGHVARRAISSVHRGISSALELRLLARRAIRLLGDCPAIRKKDLPLGAYSAPGC